LIAFLIYSIVDKICIIL